MSRTLEWKLRLYLFEEDGETKARLELDTGIATYTGHGLARCAASDTDVPEIGDELAASRALSDLAAQMQQMAYGDMEAVAPLTGRAPGTPRSGWLDMSAS
ncbi:dsRBD fold-containing protein [Streptomyces sp. NPDC056637]|uniref:dsRBD fold-containing protein n=1 Tax=unclassified Streptomyces TaxID=2593676 RepID=UPI00342653A2